MGVKFTTNATALLASPLSDTDTELSVATGKGALFPELAEGDWFAIVVVASNGSETMKATARTGDVITVTRGQDGTVARAFEAGSRVDHRATAAALDAIKAEALAAVAALDAALAPIAKSGAFADLAAVPAGKFNDTGALKYHIGNAERSGWVRANGKSIGSAASGATERANADTQALYELLWDTFNNAYCPVAGGRGETAAADFAADKALTLPDSADRGLIGLSDAGDGAKNRVTSRSEDGSGGSETATIGRTHLPASQIPVSGKTTADGSHNHQYFRVFGTNKAPSNSGGGSPEIYGNVQQVNTSNEPNHQHDLQNAKTDALGDGTPLPVMNPFLSIATLYIKL